MDEHSKPHHTAMHAAVRQIASNQCNSMLLSLHRRSLGHKNHCNNQPTNQQTGGRQQSRGFFIFAFLFCCAAALRQLRVFFWCPIVAEIKRFMIFCFGAERRNSTRLVCYFLSLFLSSFLSFFGWFARAFRVLFFRCFSFVDR